MQALKFIFLASFSFWSCCLGKRDDGATHRHIRVIPEGSFRVGGEASVELTNTSHGGSLVSIGAVSGGRSIEKHGSKCAPIPYHRGYLKRIYHVSVALSAALLDKALRQEAPLILEGMGFEYVTVGTDATFKFLQVNPTEIKMSMTSVSLKYDGVSLGTDITLFLTIVLMENSLHFKDVGVDTTPQEAPPEPREDMGEAEPPAMSSRIWSRFRRYTAPAQDAIVNFAVNKGLGAMKLNTFHRNMCLTNSGGRFDLRISQFVVDEHGDLGIGFTFHDAGCEGNWKDDNSPMLDTTAERSLLKYVGENLEENFRTFLNFSGGSDLPPSERSRLAVYFEDGFVEKMAGNEVIGAAVDGLLKAHAGNPLKDFVASSQAGGELFANIINLVLKFVGVAKDPRLEDIRTHCYRYASGWWSDSSFLVMDFTNKGHSIMQSLFSTLEKHALFGGTKGEEQADKGETPPSAATLGECSAAI